ncbi:MAG: hypothetical protein H0W81_12550 [Chloroflexi bacterium]|nr:hypothetical protein [Chloroflexota bacterium]
MAAVVTALQPLEEPERHRILDWAAKRFNFNAQLTHDRRDIGHERDEEPPPQGDHETFADMFEAARPTTAHDKALIAAYWVHSIDGKAQFASADANRLLKDIGEQIPAINKAFAVLQQRRPALVVQVRKSGNPRQGRKTLKLTPPGLRAAENLTKGAGAVLDE